MIGFAIRRPVATLTALAGLAALGIPSARRMPLELLPDVEFPRLEVSTAWPGASPEQVEALVSSPIEAAAQEVRRVRSVRSTSYAHRSVVTVEFEPGTEMEFARLDLAERLSVLHRELPPGALPPTVEPWVPPELVEGSRALLVYTVAGPRVLGALREVAERDLARELAAIPGVGAIEVVGGTGREVQVRLKPDRMAALGITPEDVRRALESGLNVARAGGSLRIGERMIRIAIDDRAEGVADVEALVVEPRRSGPAVRLGELARIRRTFAEPREVHRLDGAPAVSLYLHRLPGTNAIEVVDGVREKLHRLETKLPVGSRVIEEYDGSEQIRRELHELRDRSLLSTGCVILVLLLAFRRWRPALLIVATIAACVLATLSLMALTGLSLNLLTLAGLAMGVGLIDDNAIVVLESIEARQVRGGTPGTERTAAWTGARQVVAPVLAASLTNLIVFVPFLYLQGELRAYYVPFAMTVGLALVASLVAAFTLVPALAARAGGSRAPEGAARRRPARPARGFRSRDLYRGAIVWTVRHPRRTAVFALLALAGSVWLFWEQVPRGRSWAGLEETTFLSVQVTMPPGAGLERADEIARRIEARLSEMPAVDRYDTWVGPGHASVHVTLPDSLATTSAPLAVKERLVALSRTIGGAAVHGFGPAFEGAGGALPAYGLELKGYDYRELGRMTDDLAERLERFPRIRDVDPNAAGHWFDRERETELVLTPDRERLAAYGLSAADLLGRVGGYTGGRAIRETVALAGDEADLSLEIEGAGDADVGALLNLPLAVEGGPPVHVADVAGIHPRTTLGRIVREDQQYLRTVTWEFRGPLKLGDRARDAVVAATVLPTGYELATERSFWEYEKGEKAELALVGTLSAALVYMVTAALFESLRAPLVVLAAVPLALIGVFLLYFLIDETFTREAWIGVVMMAGIVVNNAILMVDRMGTLRRGSDGPALPLEEAAVRGALDRVRPILMTTGTTVLGLLPLVLFTEPGTASLWTALALATIGGLASSTILVVVTIPALYVVVRPVVRPRTGEAARVAPG